MKEKVGLAIVTYGMNYGTYLQAFATQYIVRKLGYETEVINIDSVRKEVGNARKRYFLKQIFNRSELMSYRHRFLGMAEKLWNPGYRAYMANREKQFEQFCKNAFLFSDKVDSWQGLTQLCRQRYSHVLVGSDQLWRPANIAGNFYTLHYVPDEINKIAYATSFGMSEVRPDQKETVKQFLSRIDHLSVRETSGVKIVKNLTDRKIPLVCDPTLLLTKEEWGQFVSDEPVIKESYILCYYLGENQMHRAFAQKLAQKTGCKVVALRHIAGYIRADNCFGDIVPENIGPYEFLNLVKNASHVCTDSFHGCVFSLIFDRSLFAFRRFSDKDRMSTNDRIKTLLSLAGVEQRLMNGDEEIETCLDLAQDQQNTHGSLSAKREESLDYLKRAFAKETTDL